MTSEPVSREEGPPLSWGRNYRTRSGLPVEIVRKSSSRRDEEAPLLVTVHGPKGPELHRYTLDGFWIPARVPNPLDLEEDDR